MKLKWTAIFSVGSPMILIIAWLLTGAGSVSPLVFIYPALFSLGIPVSDNLAFLLTFLQFPVYGLIIDLSKMKGLQKIAWIFIAVLQLTLVVVANVIM